MNKTSLLLALVLVSSPPLSRAVSLVDTLWPTADVGGSAQWSTSSGVTFWNLINSLETSTWIESDDYNTFRRFAFDNLTVATGFELASITQYQFWIKGQCMSCLFSGDAVSARVVRHDNAGGSESTVSLTLNWEFVEVSAPIQTQDMFGAPLTIDTDDNVLMLPAVNSLEGSIYNRDFASPASDADQLRVYSVFVIVAYEATPVSTPSSSRRRHVSQSLVLGE